MSSEHEAGAGRRLTRRELYEQVWSRTVRQVARDLGLSDASLAKICLHHDVPTPPRGYWAKKRAGKSVRRRSLPRAEQAETSVVIHAPTVSPAESKPHLDSDVAEAMRRADQVAALITPEGAPILPGLRSARSALRRLAREQAARQRRSGMRPHPTDLPLIDSPVGLCERGLRILDGLMRGLRELQFRPGVSSVDVSSVSVECEVLGELFTFRMRERLRSRPFDHKVDGDRGSWPPKMVFEPRGLLIVERKGPHRYDADRFQESAVGGLDGRVERMIKSTLKRVVDIRAWRKKAEQEAERRRLEQIEWERVAAEKRLHERRVAALEQLAERHDRAGRLRAFLQACREKMADVAGDDEAADRIGRWVTWGEAIADELDPASCDLASVRDLAWDAQ